MNFDQAEYQIRCEWGERGVAQLAPLSDVVIIIDVLSFSTAVEIAVNQGARVFPYRWKDETAHRFAASVDAQVADGKHGQALSLSPTSLLELPPEARLVLPSPNGSTLSLATGKARTLAGCLRNARAVAAAAMRIEGSLAVIPAGERWADGTLRPCFEDLLGAGAIIRHLRGTLSPEARAALAVFEGLSEGIFELLKSCGSGKEKASRHEEHDIKLASELNVSDCVPVLINGAFQKEG